MSEAADTCVTNARVLTMDGAGTIAAAFAVRDGRFAAVGSDAEVRALAGERTRVIDLGGAAVVPGLIDAHSHLEMLAYAWEVAVDVRSTRAGSVRDIVAILRQAARDVPEGEWILGQGEHYQHLKLAEGVYPDRGDLDGVSTVHPVIYRASYHINCFNTRALELLGVDDATPDAPGGRIERDPATGAATGRTFDMFAPLNGPQAPVGRLAEAIRKTEEMYAAVGVTAVGDIQLHTHALSALLENAREHAPRLRAVAYPKLPIVLSEDDVRSGALKERFAGVDRERLALGGVKIFLDGGLTAGAAALHDDYPDRPGYRGESAFTDDEVRRLVALADEHDLQIAMHAIGDRALDQAIAAVEALPAHRHGIIRHRIEHAGNMFMTGDRIKRMSDAGIVPVPQPAFLLTTATGYIAHLGAERIGTVMPFRTLIDAGLPIPGNSDAIGITADQHDPFPAMQAAVERRAAGGEPLDEQEAVTAYEALKMYTAWAAYAIGMDDVIGSIEPGKAADFAVLSADPTAVAPAEIGRIRARSTWLAGRATYTRA